MAVAIWGWQPSADALLAARVARGWQPDGDRYARRTTILGHAACVVTRR